MRLGRTLSPGHPDRACDIIAETVIDEYLKRDPASSLRVHAHGGKGAMFLTGIVSSKADFDVGAIVKQTAATLGAREDVEPFISLESVAGSNLLHATRTSRPLSVFGYATRENDEQIPKPVLLSRRIAKKLDDLRRYDPEWFWLEPGFEVSVTEPKKGMPIAYINCGHGTLDIADMRERVKGVALGITTDLHTVINESGPQEASSLDHDMGASGGMDEPYGNLLPFQASPHGLDPSHPRKFGSWLARGIARAALARSDAEAVMVHAIYHPRDAEPSYLKVRDERGNDLTIVQDRDSMRYSKLIEILRPGLGAEAARWGFAGEAGLPWES